MGTFLHGGTERLMLDILSRLPADIYDITACCDTNQYLSDVLHSYQQAGIRTVAFRWPVGIKLIRNLAQFIRHERFQIVHTHHYYGNLYGRIAAILGGSPIIMTYQHNWPGEEKRQHRLAFHLLNLWTYRNITVSEAIRQYDIEQVGISPLKAVTIYNGIDTTVFHPSSFEQRLQAKKSLGLTLDGEVVGMVGRLVDWKRFDLFIKAASVVLRNGRDVHFLIVGDGEMRELLLQLTYHLNLEDRVHFLGWRSDMPAIYQTMDIFCLTSDSGGKSFSMAGGEGFGLVTIEAMASGIPIVAVDTEINREVISEECGVFCPATPEALAQGLLNLIQAPELRVKLSINGWVRVRRCFDIQETAARVSAIYCEAVSGRKRFD